MVSRWFSFLIPVVVLCPIIHQNNITGLPMRFKSKVKGADGENRMGPLQRPNQKPLKHQLCFYETKITSERHLHCLIDLEQAGI